MKKLISKKIIPSLLITGLFLFFSGSALAAQVGQTYNFKDQSGLGAAAGTAGYDIGTSATTLESVISRIIYTLLSFIGILFFGLVIYGGFTWMTARGNEEKVKKAEGSIMNALVGLIITLSAYALSYFLINYFWQ
ncbi:MAG: hypothetical protein WC719_02350 [Patescibacteria group bacterium]|jgi:hypothetical protein